MTSSETKHGSAQLAHFAGPHLEGLRGRVARHYYFLLLLLTITTYYYWGAPGRFDVVGFVFDEALVDEPVLLA